jgi:putative mRNA 3-end processing factor
MRVWYDRGLHLEMDGTRLLLDPVGAKPIDARAALISHGHADHASGLDKLRDYEIVAHPATAEYKRKDIHYSNEFRPVKGSESLEIAGLKVEAYRSAHCVGGLQFRIVGNEGAVVFTGDLNLSGSLVETSPPVLEGDVLLIEANFGHPDYIFPPRSKSYMRLVGWMHKYRDKPIILFGHGLGKTQELTQLLGDSGVLGNGGGGRLYVSGNALSSNIIFEKYRYRFKARFRPYKRSAEMEPGDFLIHPIYERVTPVSVLRAKRDLGLEEAAFAHISGWTVNQPGDYNFPLSSHSDFSGLMEYIKSSGAERVYTFHGYSETLAEKAREEGFEASHLTAENPYE